MKIDKAIHVVDNVVGATATGPYFVVPIKEDDKLNGQQPLY